jgi:hypothetical protein
MSRINTIDLNRGHQAIADDLQKRPNHELRAKKINGRMVLYTRKVGVLGRLIGNCFHNRQEKLEAARTLVLKRFENFPPGSRDAVMSGLSKGKTTAHDYAMTFAQASEKTSKVKFSNLEGAPVTLGAFLSWDARERFMPALQTFADTRQLTRELSFAQDLANLQTQSGEEAIETAAQLCQQIFTKDWLNVYPDKVEGLAKDLGLKQAPPHNVTMEYIAGLNKTPDELHRLVAKWSDRLMDDLARNLYPQFRSQVIGDSA